MFRKNLNHRTLPINDTKREHGKYLQHSVYTLLPPVQQLFEASINSQKDLFKWVKHDKDDVDGSVFYIPSAYNFSLC